MDAERHARTRFLLVNLAWTVVIVGIVAITVGLAAVYVDWSDTRLYGVLGLVAGTAIGGVRDRKVSQAVLGVTGIVLLAFALYWSSGSIEGSDEQVLALLSTAGFAFLTSFTLTRVWGRDRPPTQVTSEDLDEAVAHPHPG